ncbi:MAG: carboxypeptidase-like regulatory domain-containing protein, partial [Bdellovibrionales bacterium]
EYSFEASIKDLAKNIALPSPYKVNFKIDRTKPTIAIELQEPILTNKTNFDIPIVVNDLNPTNTSVYVNDSLSFTTGLKQFTAVVALNLEGNNIIKVVSSDAAGNISDIKQLTIVRDSTPPVLSNLLPVENSTIANAKFEISGTSNEPLSEITVNGMVLNRSSDKMSFSGQYVSSTQGENTLIFIAKDLLGNLTTINSRVNISDRLLVKELVTIIPDADNRHYIVVGKAGAARASAEISVSAGLLSLNRGSDVASLSGTFSVRLDKFTKVTVKAKDLETNEEDSFELNFDVPTQIAGVIKDTDDAPLSGATVRILGTNIAVVSDASGVFSIQNAPVGDQTMSIDGSTIAQPSTGAQRKFSVHNLSISVSAGQVNTFSKPIYLTATLLDGSGTTVANNA